MKRWQDFLDSLSTKGGNIFLMCIAVTGLILVFLHVVHHAPDVAIVETFKSILSGFAGALLAMLSGNSSRQQIQDRVAAATVPGAQSVDVAAPSTVNIEAPKDAQ